MKEQVLYHGIPIVGRMPLFRADMRQAVRDNRKTQTRRVIKPQPAFANSAWHWKNICWGVGGAQISDEFIVDHCPYGKPGGVRCMREPLTRIKGVACYQDDYAGYLGKPVISLITGKPLKWRWKKPWLASIHMPTEAARMVRQVTGVRVERLQEISEEGAVREGVDSEGGWDVPQGEGYGSGFGFLDYAKDEFTCDTAIGSFSSLWDSVNAKRGFGWDTNPWVWAIRFKRVGE